MTVHWPRVAETLRRECAAAGRWAVAALWSSVTGQTSRGRLLRGRQPIILAIALAIIFENVGASNAGIMLSQVRFTPSPLQIPESRVFTSSRSFTLSFNLTNINDVPISPLFVRGNIFDDDFGLDELLVGDISQPLDQTSLNPGDIGHFVVTNMVAPADALTRAASEFFEGPELEPYFEGAVTVSVRGGNPLETKRFSTIPEPSTLTLFSLSVLILFGYGWRHRMRATI